MRVHRSRAFEPVTVRFLQFHDFRNKQTLARNRAALAREQYSCRDLDVVSDGTARTGCFPRAHPAHCGAGRAAAPDVVAAVRGLLVTSAHVVAGADRGGALFSDGFEALEGLTAVCLTHQHVDHLDAERLRRLLDRNPGARVVSDEGSAEGLGQAGADVEVVHDGDELDLGGLGVAVRGRDHAAVHPDVPVVPNVGYLVGGRLFHPGDALTEPGEPVERRVRAILLDMGTGAATDVVASLTRAAIDSLVELDPAVERAQVERLRALRQRRDAEKTEVALTLLEDAARSTDNLLPRILSCVESLATVGEISHRLRRVWGEYREAVTV